MSRVGHAQQVMNEIGAEVGLTELPLDGEGRHLANISGLNVTFLYRDEPVEVLWLFVDIADVPDEPDQLRGLLRFGFATWVSNQMTLGLDESGKRLVGFAAIPVAVLATDNLRSVLESMLAAATAVIDRVAHGECHSCGAAMERCECSPITALRA